jgi:hypothetical protein
MKKVAYPLILFVSIMWVLHTVSKNFIVDPQLSRFLSMKSNELLNKSLWVIMIRIHIILAVIALITGPIALSKKIRIESLLTHRWMGRIYVGSIVLNYIPSFYVSFYATGGFPSVFGFFILNTLWLFSTLRGFWLARTKKIMLHSQWMIRSYALSLANMTIHILVTLFYNALDFRYEFSYTLAVWLCWLLNLSLAEFAIRMSSNSSKK